MSKKNSKQNSAATVEATVENTTVVETTTIEATEVGNVEEVIEALEQPTFDAMNKEFLETANPADYFSPEVCSSKYDAEREPKVFMGLQALTVVSAQVPELQINPLLILLGKWWEVKPARAAIKKMIDVEASEKGYNSDAYLQIELNKEIEKLTCIQTAVDRLRYAKTYFKPRAGVSTSVPTKQIRMDDEIWNVPIALLELAKAEYKDKEDLKRYLKTVSTKQDIKEVEML